jgi:hypothetical protein
MYLTRIENIIAIREWLVAFMEENSRVKRRKMQHPILGCYWAENAESLENKGIERFSFRFESTSAHQNRIFIHKSAVFCCINA